ncbi:hypothetical protein [Prosthecobacter sp.]|uniref:hypothetical protein n=1 Tax=Prosthecobacter sp. TaxID=1965333 RepID=UPI001DB97573|nr:hypothetical protein [Prosthecobacter sp.]MCA9422689.1 hypothetical protein [Nitrospira sp.]MCB1279661.1 hypothetical protein [Prosthecobacter sp.]
MAIPSKVSERLATSLYEYHTQRQAVIRFLFGAMVVSDSVVDTMRLELKKVSPGVRFDNENIRQALITKVIKREVLEGDKATEAQRKIGRAIAKVAVPKVILIGCRGADAVPQKELASHWKG